MLSAFLSGIALGGSLIVAIGAQNAFIIRQGILAQHVFWLCLFCAVSDTILIFAGAYGLSTVVTAWPKLIPIMTYGGAAFLFAYGCKAAYRAIYPDVLQGSDAPPLSLTKAISICAGFTFLNPHVYLDTVVLVGTLANSRGPEGAIPFAMGASCASFIWFFSLGYGAKALRKYLAKPRVWRIIDTVIAVVMFVLAIKLLLP